MKIKKRSSHGNTNANNAFNVLLALHLLSTSQTFTKGHTLSKYYKHVLKGVCILTLVPTKITLCFHVYVFMFSSGIVHDNLQRSLIERLEQ